ncbi:MAG: rhodanese-like domain-containing protein, partial [Candidatus Polarisedimenticolia bacterium]
LRTEEEFAAGHPEGAINVPIGIANPALQRLEANPDFLAVTRAAAPEGTPLLVGCATGPRAQMAARLLTENGYTDVRWVLGGMHGITDPMGRVVAPGWTALGLPESREAGDGAAYRSLRRKAGLD